MVSFFTKSLCSSIVVCACVCCGEFYVDVGCKLCRWSWTASSFHSERGNMIKIVTGIEVTIGNCFPEV